MDALFKLCPYCEIPKADPILPLTNMFMWTSVCIKFVFLFHRCNKNTHFRHIHILVKHLLQSPIWSVPIKQLHNCWMNLHEICNYGILQEVMTSLKFCLKLDKHIGHLTQSPICISVCIWSLQITHTKNTNHLQYSKKISISLFNVGLFEYDFQVSLIIVTQTL